MKPPVHKRFLILDAFRGFAAVLVTLFHAHFSGVFLPGSWLAVDFFFMLSGFVLAHVYFYDHADFKHTNTVKFLSHRFARLYPLHFATLLFLLLYFLLVENHLDSKNSFSFSFLSHLFLINNIGFNIAGTLSWNPPAWSVSVEWAVNLLFLFIFIKLKKPILIFIAIFIYTLIYYANLNLAYASSSLFSIFNIGMLRGIAGFFIGLGIYSLYRYMLKYSLVFTKNIFTLLEIVSFFSILIFFYFYNDLQRPDFIALFLFVVLLLIFSFEGGFLSSILIKLKANKLGDWSYSIYLIHFPLLYIFKDLHAVIPVEYRIFIFFPILFLLSWTIYTYFERPMAKRYRNIFIDINKKQILTVMGFIFTLMTVVLFVDGYKLKMREKEKIQELYKKIEKSKPIIKNKFTIYKHHNKLIFIKHQCTQSDIGEKFFVHFHTDKSSKYSNKDFYFNYNGIKLENGSCLSQVTIPPKSKRVILGQYVPKYRRSWEATYDFSH